jgi:hypothetical protein
LQMRYYFSITHFSSQLLLEKPVVLRYHLC